jgi:hypothetical protein
MVAALIGWLYGWLVQSRQSRHFKTSLYQPMHVALLFGGVIYF